MMRDALAPTEDGLVRPSPEPGETVGEDGDQLPRLTKTSETERYRQETVTERRERREERRLETRKSDGHVLSSNTERLESIEERTATKDLETDDQGILEPNLAKECEDTESKHPVLEIEQEPGEADGG